MRKAQLAGLFLVAAASLAISQNDADYSKTQIKVTKVAGKVYMLEGADAGNIAASIGDDGIVIVNDQYAPLAEKIQAALKGITGKPIRFIINTHYYGTTAAETNTSRSKRPSLRTTMFESDSPKAVPAEISVR